MVQLSAYTVISTSIFSLNPILLELVSAKIKWRLASQVFALISVVMDTLSILQLLSAMTIILLVEMDAPQIVKYKITTNASTAVQSHLPSAYIKEYPFKYNFLQSDIQDKAIKGCSPFLSLLRSFLSTE